MKLNSILIFSILFTVIGLNSSLSGQKGDHSIPKHSISLTSGPIIPDINSHAGISYSFYPSNYLELQGQIKLLGIGAAARIHFLGTQRYRVSPYVGTSYSVASILDSSSIFYIPVGAQLALSRRLFLKGDLGYARYQWSEFISDSGAANSFSFNLEIEYALIMRK